MSFEFFLSDPDPRGQFGLEPVDAVYLVACSTDGDHLDVHVTEQLGTRGKTTENRNHVLFCAVREALRRCDVELTQARNILVEFHGTADA